MPRFRATLAYDGTAYQGFQRQRDGVPTVQNTVEQAIQRITSQAVSVIAAGRTDSGVHAVGQVIAFDADWTRPVADLLRGINAVLPSDVALQDLQEQAGFHPRYDALSRQYIYTIIQSPQRQPLWVRRAWIIREPLNMDVMNAAAALFVGRHDFAALGHPPQGENTVRDLFVSEWAYTPHSFGSEYVYTVRATAFLHHMVRRMVGLMADVGRGWMALEACARIFADADISQVKTIAPPQGLVLASVQYP
ncbi:MAG: tRNA pseudouridine(38-40) synthase TruA [Chloroflexi bacterium AL-W]|nr:tRNA pseudouridine(38-40) synthase TruA [Chloroflexi bacterium AL-W]